MLVISTRLGYTMRARMRRRALRVNFSLSFSLSSFFSSSFSSSSFSSFSARAICLRVPPPSSTCHEGRKEEGKSRGKKKNRAGYVACMWWCIRKGVLRCIREKLHGRKTQTWQKKLRSLLRALVKEKERQGALRNQNWKRWWIRIVAIRIYSIIDITAGWISILASVNLI